MSKEFSIGSFIPTFLSPYIIAEIGVNHEGSLEKAKNLILDAKEAGAHAAKFQTYKAEKLSAKHSPAYWDTSKEKTQSQYKLFQKYDSFGKEEYIELSLFCNKIGIDFLSTPFDLESVDFLSSLMPAFKLASADITNLPLLRKIGACRKPVIVSTGAASIPEIAFAVEELERSGAIQVALLHCVLNYPTAVEHAQLSMIPYLSRIFQHHCIGYSDHVTPFKGMPALEVAAMSGALIIEKHFTYDKSLPGNDHYHAMDKTDLKNFVSNLIVYRNLYGNGVKDLTLEQSARANARRSIYASRDINAGETITENDIIAKRPGLGISPIFWDQVIGKKMRTSINNDEPLTWPHFE
ncbi:Sialic acid synthase [Hahella chejuensis KCTC 2396]|uniref:Sialic acid synthase n=1 Tax=Hahella chejuensis (strain KCTC 2396) TaxID=349521 RepID=Q2SBN4_HAHCH|nr:N-acetylneuraminate synthase family protein [Hahella chejuensis]ABC31940.1 Sialic acid synthase [Hahella chejuensis KCTC 2396]